MSDATFFNVSDPTLDNIATAHDNLVEYQKALTSLQKAATGNVSPDEAQTQTEQASKDVAKTSETKAGEGTMASPVVTEPNAEFPGSVMATYKGLQLTATPKDTNTDEGWMRWTTRAMAQVGYSPLAGLIGAVNETGKFAEQVNSGFNQYLGKVIGKDLADDIWPGGDKFPHIPEPDPDTTPGKISKSVVQFIAGMVGAGKLLKLGGFMEKGATLAESPILRNLTTSSLAAGIVFDSHEANIGNVIREFPTLQGPLTNWMDHYLATGESDSILEGRLKNVIGNVALGVPAEYFMKMLAYAGTQMRGVKANSEVTDTAQKANRSFVSKLQTLDLTERKLALMGDPTASPFRFYDLDADALKAANDAQRVKPAPGYAYDWSADHAPPGQEPPNIIPQVDFPKEMNRVTTKVKAADGSTFSLNFQSQEDRLAYIATAGGARAEQAMEVLKSAGWTEAQVNNIAKKLRDDISSRVEGTPKGSPITPANITRDTYSQSLSDFLGTPADYAASALVRVPLSGKTGIEFNWGAIRDPGGMANVITQMKAAFEAQPGTRTWAEAMGNSDTAAMVDRVFGDVPTNRVLTDAETDALRVLRVGSYLKLRDLADMVSTARELPGGVNSDMTYAFAMQLNTMRMINNYWRSSGTEIARSLNIRKNVAMAVDPINQGLRDLDRYLGTVQGVSNVEYMADVVRNLDAGTPEAMKAFNKLIDDSNWMRAGKYLRAERTNALLSSKPSLINNAIMPFVVTATQMAERTMGIMANRALGDETGMTMGSMMHYMAGYFGAFREGASYFPDALRFGGKGRAWGEQYARGTTDDLAHPNALNDVMSSYLRPDSGFWLSRGIDVMGYANSWATRLNIACDEFHATVNYRAELQRLTYDQIRGEVASGVTNQADFSTRMAELLSKPPRNLAEQAVENSHYLTFTNENNGAFMKVATAIQNVGKGYPIGGWMLVPFKQVPANILSYSFDHSPFLLRKQDELRQAITSGGQEAQVALGKLAGATFATSLGIDMYQRGLITGKGSYNTAEEQLQAREGILPYSVKLGDKYMRYNRFDSVGALWGVIADMGDYYSYLNDQDHDRAADLEKATSAFIIAMSGSMLNKSYFTGINDLFKATGNPTAPQYAQNFFNNQVASLIPNEGLLRGTQREFGDDAMKDVKGLFEHIGSQMPGIGNNQPDAHDLLGRVKTISRGTSQTWNAMMPFEMSALNPEPIDTEWAKQHIYIQMPDRKFKFGNYTIDMTNDNRAYERYVELAGNAAVDSVYGMGMKDLSNNIVTGLHSLSSSYNRLPDGTGQGSAKQKFWQAIVTHYRKIAQQQLLQEQPNIYHYQSQPTPLSSSGDDVE